LPFKHGFKSSTNETYIGHFDSDDLEKTISIIWFPGCKIYVVATDRYLPSVYKIIDPVS